MGILHDIGTCADCGVRRIVKHREWIRAASPRCYACGGRLLESMASHDEHVAGQDAKRKQHALIDRKMKKDHDERS